MPARGQDDYGDPSFDGIDINQPSQPPQPTRFQPGPIINPPPLPPPIPTGPTELCPDGTVVPTGEPCPPVMPGPVPPGPGRPPTPQPPPQPNPPPTPTPNPPVDNPPPTDTPPPDGGGGCPCGPSGGGPGGGGGGGGGTPSCPPPPNACVKHDGSVIDADTGQTLSTNSNGDVLYNQSIPGCEGSIAGTDLPYCDDMPPKECPHPAEEKGEKCCKEAFQAIADAMKEIAKGLDKKFELTQEMIDKWLDYIAKKIKDKILPPAKTCDECCKRIELGLATAAECAMVSANCTCQQCVDSCESFNEGECCKNCGKANCTCKGGKCVGEDKPELKWQSYCKGDQRDIYQGDKVPTADGWTYNGSFDSRDEAESAADSACRDDGSPSPGSGGQSGGSTLPPVILPDGSTLEGVCEAQRYDSRITATNFLQNLKSPDIESRVIAGVRDTAGRIADAVGGGTSTKTALASGILASIGGYFFNSVASDILAAASGADPRALGPAIATLVTIASQEKVTGVELPILKVGLNYGLNAAIRPMIYTPEQALAAALSGRIEISNVDRYFAAAGYCEEVSRGMIQAEKSKPGPPELARMRRRKLISESEYGIGMRQVGYLEPELAERLFKLTEVLPGPGDLVQFMKRDTDDPNIVDRFKLDSDFSDKYNEKIKDWAKQNGIPDEIMKYHWRAHWDIPSPTALTEMYRRLRYDDVPANEKVTLDDVRTALEQQDILPTWIDKYIALMHPPLGRIDIRRAYQNGTLDDDQTKRALGELGLSDDNIDKMFKFMQRLKEQGASNHRAIKRWIALLSDREQVQNEMQQDGYTVEQIDKAMETASTRLVSSLWAKSFVSGEIDEIEFRNLLSSHGVTGDSVDSIVNLLSYRIKDTATVKAYVSGILTRQSALDRMTRRGMQQSAAQHELDAADDAFNSAHAAKCASNIKGRYVRGAMDADEAKSKLVVNGIASEWADRLISKWRCELGSKDKAVTADKLCGFVARGAMDSGELKSRLIRLGYSEPDALNLVGDCADRINTQQAKEQAKQQREQDSKQKQAQATARRNQATAEKLIKQAEAARKAKNTLRATRQTQELGTLKNLLVKCDCTNEAAISMYNQNKDRIRSQLGLSIDEANRVLLKASEIWSDGDPLAYPLIVDELALSLATGEVEDITPEP